MKNSKANSLAKAAKQLEQGYLKINGVVNHEHIP